MVSNQRRIFSEIEREANFFFPDCRAQRMEIIRLIRDIVDLEDKNRIKAQHRIHQKITGMIQTIAQRSGKVE